MDLATKLQLKPDQKVACLSRPRTLNLAVANGTAEQDEHCAVLVFAADVAALVAHRETLVSAASAGQLTWVAYPKSGQLGTDLNRDRVAKHLTDNGLRPVRQVAVDEVWSAVRVRTTA